MLQELHELQMYDDTTTQCLHYIQLDSAYFPCDESIYADCGCQFVQASGIRTSVRLRRPQNATITAHTKLV